MRSDRTVTSDADAADFPMPEIDANGVDRVQIRRHLDLSPDERLQHLEAFVASVMAIRQANERAEIPRDPASPR